MATKFFWNNIINEETSTITNPSSDIDSFYPLTNLTNYLTIKEVRTTTSDLSTIILIDSGSAATTADSFLITGHAVSGALNVSEVTIEANPTNSWGSPAFSTSTTDISSENLGYHSFTEQTYRW